MGDPIMLVVSDGQKMNPIKFSKWSVKIKIYWLAALIALLSFSTYAEKIGEGRD